MDISFSPWVICYFVYFVAQVVLALAMRNSFKLTPVCQQTFYLFFFDTFYHHKMFLIFCHHKLFQVHLVCHFIFCRLVRVSKNYRSVIRACMEEMHQFAGKYCVYE